MKAISSTGAHSTSVVRLADSAVDDEFQRQNPEVVATIIHGRANAMANAIAKLNTMDVAVIQHEFGIYGGLDGEDVLTILRGLHIPAMTVLHTVLANPTWHQRQIVTEICERSATVITMSESARQLLLTQYLGDPFKIFAIPHGAPNFPAGTSGIAGKPPTILTWGLIGPGKGIEWAIEAMSYLRDLKPMPRYLVVGRTHPKVLVREGERYRRHLESLIDQYGLSDCVELRAEYLAPEKLSNLAPSSSVVVLPYDSTQQVTSGVLIEAIAARRPVVATDFPHAREMLAEGVGLLVPHQDPVALSKAIRAILTDPNLSRDISLRAARMAPQLLWPSIGARYVNLAASLLRTKQVA